MRSLAAEVSTEKDRKFTRPFPSAIFHFGGAVGDVAISNHDLLIAGIAHQGCVQEWGEYEAMAQQDGQFSTGSMRMRIINKPLFGSPLKRFSDLFAGVGVEGIEVEINQNWQKADSPGTIYQARMFDGVLRPGDFSPEICELEIAPISEKYLDAEITFPINQTDFPNALADEIGKPANLIVGSAKNVRCQLVSTGLKGTVRSTMPIGATAVTVHDVLYDGLPSSGSVIIGGETIAYSAKAGSAGSRTLTCSATTQSHNKDDTIIQVVSNWIFLAAGRASKAISTVYVRRGDKKIPLAASQYSVNLANTSLVSGKTLTTITFTAPPLVAEKDYVAIDPASAEATYEQAGSDETIQIQPPTPWPAGNTVTANISFPSQDKTKSSGSFIKSLTFAYVSGGVGARNAYLRHQGGDIQITAGGTEVGIKPVQVVNTNFWSLQIAYINEGAQLANPPELHINLAAKRCAYNVSAASSLSSTSTADNPIGDIYCDIDGVADDGSGTYTGSASALIEKPADFVHWLSRVAAGVPSNRVNAQSFIDARTEMNSAVPSYKFAGVISERATKLKKALLALSEQGRLKIDWPADVLNCRFLKSSYGAAVKTITENNIRAIKTAQGLKTTLRLGHTPVEELINKIDLRYGRDWSLPRNEDAFSKISSDSDSTSISKYGTRTKPEWFWYDFVDAANSTMADDLRAFWLGRRKEPARTARLEAFLDQFELLPGDVAALRYQLADFSYFDGLNGSNKFLLENVRIAPNAPARALVPIIRLQHREVP